MGPSDGLRKHHGDVYALDLLAFSHVLVLWDGVGHDDSLKARRIDPAREWKYK